MYLKKQWEPVDFVFSYSSLEHDGLGRYGDPINPFADLESVGRVWCMLKDGGMFLLGLPMAWDTVVRNYHRSHSAKSPIYLIVVFFLLVYIGLECPSCVRKVSASACHHGL